LLPNNGLYNYAKKTLILLLMELYLKQKKKKKKKKKNKNKEKQFSSPHPHVKHYHIKQNQRGEFYLSEKHCCGSIPDLVNYHRHNSGGLASRLKASPCDRPVPPTAGLSHGTHYFHF
jgi:hypothetical protein